MDLAGGSLRCSIPDMAKLFVLDLSVVFLGPSTRKADMADVWRWWTSHALPLTGYTPDDIIQYRLQPGASRRARG